LSRLVKVVNLKELATNPIYKVNLNGQPILLILEGDEVFAISGVCTHEEADLSYGTIRDNVIVCPLHSSEFDLKTGVVELPPASKPLRTFRTKIQDDAVFLFDDTSS